MKNIKRKLWNIALVGVLALTLFGCEASKENQSVSTEIPIVTRDVFAMDTVMTITAYGERAEEAVSAAEDEIKRLEALLSTGQNGSEISILNENGKGRLSEDIVHLVKKSLDIFQSTEGAFDVTVYPLMEAWGFTTEKYQVPKQEKIDTLLKHVDASRIEFDETSGFVSLPENTKIDLGGIAKGYTSDKIMEIFEKYDVVSGMVSLGGNVQVYRTKPEGEFWRVGIENPEAGEPYLGILTVQDQAVITSGGYERYFEQDGKTYHHIIDPKTGYPAENGLKSVTIVSADGTLADGLSTALFVMGKERALEYWKEHQEQFDVILEEDNGEITITGGIEGDFISDYEYEVVR